jgi:hypothetical protein
MDTPAVRLRKDRGRGKEDRGPVKNETNETQFNTPRKNYRRLRYISLIA